MSSCVPKTHKNPVVLRASMTSRFLLSKNSFTDNAEAALVLALVSSLLATISAESFPPDVPIAETASDITPLSFVLSGFPMAEVLEEVLFFRCFLSFYSYNSDIAARCLSSGCGSSRLFPRGRSKRQLLCIERYTISGGSFKKLIKEKSR